MNKIKMTFVIITLALAILACGSLTITNNSNLPASVSVTMPDDNTNVVVISAGGRKTYFSFEGGPYYLQVFPSENYIAAMKEYEDQIVEFLLLGDLANFINNTDIPDDRYAFFALEKVQELIEDELETSAVCGGTLNANLINGLLLLTAGGNVDEGPNELQVSVYREGNEWKCE